MGTAVGWIVYMTVWLRTDFHGGLKSIIQPFLAGIVSLIFVGMAFVVGLPLRIPVLRCLWSRIRFFSPLITAAGIVTIFCAEDLGLTHEVIHPETEEPEQGMMGLAYFLSFLALVFPWVNWPQRNPILWINECSQIDRLESVINRHHETNTHTPPAYQHCLCC